MQKGIVVATAVGLVGASLSAGSVAHAATKPYKVVKNKLVQQKTGKPVKGYVVFKGKLYKNGKLNKGYAKIGNGKSMKLYYDANLKKGYKKANNKTLLFHNGILAKGQVQTKDKKSLYVDGKLAQGEFVYENLDGKVFLYEDGQLSKGIKTATYETITCLFNDGLLADGNRIYNGKLYENGKPNVGLKYVGGIFYFDTDLANAEIDGVRYEKGKVTATAEQLQVEKAGQNVADAEEVVYETKTDYIEFNKITNNASGNKAPVIKPSSLKKKNVMTLAEFIEKYKDKELTAEDKAEILSLRNTYEAQATQNLQTALQNYEVALKTYAEAIQVAVKAGDNAEATAAWQQALASKAKTVTALQEEVATFNNIQFNASAIVDALNAAVSATGGTPISQPSTPKEEPIVSTPDDNTPSLEEPSEQAKPAPDANDDLQPAQPLLKTQMDLLNEKMKAGTDILADYQTAGFTFEEGEKFTALIQPALREAAQKAALNVSDVNRIASAAVQTEINTIKETAERTITYDWVKQLGGKNVTKDQLEKALATLELPYTFTVNVENKLFFTVVTIDVQSPYDVTYQVKYTFNTIL